MNFNFDVPYETELLREKTSKVLKEFDSYIGCIIFGVGT